ncbi:MAG: SlyX family protein [Pseudomonadota bacterium]
MSDDEQVEALETRIAFYEQELSELRDAIDAQQQQILAVERRAELLMQRIADLIEGGSASGDGDERPPHY